jgi:penicillin-binding protein 1C
MGGRPWQRSLLRLSRVTVRVALGCVLLIAATLALASWRIGPPPLANAEALSVTVLDRQDRLLRAYTTADGRWRLPVEVADIDPRYLAMLIAFEDRRFSSHIGADPLAFARAAGQLVRYGRIISGGSTLTMQVARLLEGRHERTGSGKLKQIVRALQIERRLSKDEVLRLYLRLAPFGGNIEGVRAAALAYFGKEPRRLSPGEAALLVALPQSPETRKPGRGASALARARDRVLARAVDAGIVSAAEAALARREPLPRARRDFPLLAPHLADAETQRHPARSVHRLTIDRDLQRGLEALARDHVKALGTRLSAAIVALDHKTGEILAEVGSAGYLDEERQGAVDMTAAVRSPGSTLKPFIYGLAFEAGLAHPETLIEDQPARFGSYRPKNFDEDFHGTVTIRHALAQSLNIPAVKALNAVGPQRLIGSFQRAGIEPVLPGGTEPSLAIALGGIGMRLTDLATLYAALANQGEIIQFSVRRDNGSIRSRGSPPTILPPVAAWYVTDILKDAPPPASARGGRIAYKTGTSYGYRDAWAVGYDGRHTIAVWVGRPDGAATAGLTGRTAAAPVLFDAFQQLGERRQPLPAPPSAALRTTGADLPPPLRRFREGNDEAVDAGPFLAQAVQISFPPDRAELEVKDASEPIVIKTEGGQLPLTWLVDGSPVDSDAHARELAWIPTGRGFVRLSVIDARGRVDRVVVRIK